MPGCRFDMEHHTENAEAGARGSVHRACDWCRSRKARCNKASPCQNCKQAKVVCERKLLLKHKPKAQRVLISPEYREKIDRIEQRLQKITQILMDMKEQTQTPVKEEQRSPVPKPHPLLAPKAPKFTAA